jgi:hypothetical protein
MRGHKKAEENPTVFGTNGIKLSHSPKYTQPIPIEGTSHPQKDDKRDAK